MTQPQLDYVARIIGNSLHDLTKIWSGYISTNAVKSILLKKDPFKSLTDDHYLSRLQSGKQIVEQLNEVNNIPFDLFLNTIREACSVHKILKSENNNLIKYQSKGGSWTKSYISCGIDLIYVGDEMGKLPSKLTYKHLQQFEWLLP